MDNYTDIDATGAIAFSSIIALAVVSSGYAIAGTYNSIPFPAIPNSSRPHVESSRSVMIQILFITKQTFFLLIVSVSSNMTSCIVSVS